MQHLPAETHNRPAQMPHRRKTLFRALRWSSCLTVILMACLPTTPASAQLIESFEDYVDTIDLLSEWSRGELDETTTTPFGTKSLQNGGPTSGDGSGWSSARIFPMPIDMSASGTFDLWVRRDATSVGPVRFSASLSDTDGQSCSAQGQPVVADTEWHLLSINLAKQCFFVNLAEINEIAVVISNQSGGPGDVLGNFDDLRSAGIFTDGFETGDTQPWDLSEPK